MKRITCIALSVACLAASASFGKDAPKANPYAKVLGSVPAGELPAKAADLVLQAKPAAQEAATIDVVKGAVGMNPASAASIVSAIARAVPEMAPVAAGTAAAQVPKLASAIAKAAAAAAPSQAAAIVTAVCRAVPKDYRNIAIAVSQVAPGADEKIVQAVAAALPDLKPSLDRALAGYGGKAASVSSTLTQAAQIASTGTTSTPPSASTTRPSYARGPAVGPPYIPLHTTATNVTSGTAGPVPDGGRNYASP
jgi:hypothetical protein